MSDTLREAVEELVEKWDKNGYSEAIFLYELRAILAAHPADGETEPPGEVLAVTDCTDGEGDDSNQWGRTFDGEWKGYKDGGKCYLGWEELVRRWGPITWQVSK